LGGPDSTAWINNNRGQVAGWSYISFVANPSTGVPTVDPFIWSPQDGKMTDLGGLGGTYGYTTWLNNQGQVVGASNLPGDQTQHPFIWSKSQGMVDLFLNGGLGGNFGYPDWVNDAGEVVGTATIPGDQDSHAFLWRNGEMIDLGTVGSDPDSEAHSINSQGQIVGASLSFALDINYHGFLWENGGPIVDLNTLVLPGTSTHVGTAQFINDRGEIACTGHSVAIPDGHPCMLIPCDENHPNIEGCDYSLVETASTAEPARSTANTNLATDPGALSPGQMIMKYRQLIANRNRRSAGAATE
jgi:probable HAF family extracellular repeat protein